MPKDRVTGMHQGYGFVEYRTEEDADYVRDVTRRSRPREVNVCEDEEEQEEEGKRRGAAR